MKNLLVSIAALAAFCLFLLTGCQSNPSEATDGTAPSSTSEVAEVVSPASPAPEVLDSEPKVVMHDLIGMNFDKVKQTIGRVPDETYRLQCGPGGGNFLNWFYNNTPKNDYKLLLSFYTYEGFEPKDKTVQWVCYKLTNENTDGFLSPRQMLPKEVLSQNPTNFYRVPEMGPNHVAITWKVKQRLYFLIVTDSNRQLIDETKKTNENGELVSGFQLNQSGRDFLNCDKVVMFICINHVPAEMFLVRDVYPKRNNPNKGAIRGLEFSMWINFLAFDR